MIAKEDSSQSNAQQNKDEHRTPTTKWEGHQTSDNNNRATVLK